MTNDKIAISRAKSLLRKYKLGKVTLDNLVYIIEDQGYEIIEYSLGEKNNILNTASGTHHIEEVAEFLRKIPEAISNGVLVFAMTNMIDMIDPAILRRGRFDHIIEVKMASKEEIAAYLTSKFEELPVAEDASIDYISGALDSHPFSDVTYILREAGKLAVKSGKEVIDKECFDKALSTLPKKEEKRKIGFA